MTSTRVTIALLVLAVGLCSSCGLARVFAIGLMDGQAGAPVLIPIVFGPGAIGVFACLVILALGMPPPGGDADGPTPSLRDPTPGEFDQVRDDIKSAASYRHAPSQPPPADISEKPRGVDPVVLVGLPLVVLVFGVVVLLHICFR